VPTITLDIIAKCQNIVKFYFPVFVLKST
jgi:hypothetical protein